MKNLKTRLLLFMLPCLPLGLGGQTTLIEIHLNPDIQSPKVDTVSLNDPRLGQPTPVMDEAKAALGWHFADFSGEMDGYVPDAKIGKDLLPVDNCIIYSGPSEKSTVIGVVQSGDSIEVLDTGAWWQIRFSGGIPVYFVLDTPAPLPEITAAVDPIPAQLPVIEESPAVVEDAPVTVAASAAATTVGATQTKNPRPDLIGQSYHGTFKRSKKQFGLFKPKAVFYLEDSSGDRIAWLDISDIVLPGSIKAFIDQPVIIHGERSRIKSDWMIHARNMRLK